ncbi:hypothetical protein C6502_08745 [Candidatus Poribacteria bacterium]|nr:MAG: hypothetical protein C6502_08745 [Candidatus Poribacteria bacterium]
MPLLLIFLLPLAALSQTGTIEGTVYDGNTNAPVVGAEVHILGTDERQTTDTEGKFWFIEMVPGTYTVSITHEMYDTPTETDIEVTAGHTIQVTLYLGEVLMLEEVIVEGERLPPTISRKDIRGSELIRIPGVGNDALKGLTTLPSIGVPNDYFGILYIRGSEPGSNLYYFDRTPLGYPFHWGGLLSTVSSEVIDKIDIYAGGYGAEFGLDSQAVLDIHSRDSLEEQMNGKFNLNLLYSEGMLERRIGDEGYVSIAGRRSYIDLIVGRFIDEQQFPYFSDYQLKFAYPLGEKHHLTLNSFAATDHFHVEEATSVEVTMDGDEVEEGANTFEGGRTSFFFKNGFNAQGIHLRSNFTENLTSQLSLTRSFNFLTIDFKSPITESYEFDSDGELISEVDYGHYDISIRVPVYTLREDLSYSLNLRPDNIGGGDTPAALETGFLFSFTPANSFEDSRIPQYVGSEEPIEMVTPIVEDGEVVGEIVVYEEQWELVDIEESHYEFGHDFFRAEGYLQGRYDPLPFLSGALGVRLDYLDVTDQLSIQPRGSLSFALPSGSNLRFAYGHYEQSPQPHQILSENGNSALESSLARHYIMELEHELSARTEFKFATYYKDMRKLVTADEIANYLNQGAAYVSGAEVFLRHRVPDKFFGWISYAYTHAERRENPKATYHPYFFDNTNIVSVVANYNFTPKFEIGAKWQYLNGTSEVPISSVVLIQDPMTRGLNPLLADVDESVTAELTPYHKLDLRVSYKFDFMGLRVGGFLDILNVYNRKNTVKFVFTPDEPLEVQGEEVEIEEPEIFEAQQFPRIPYIGLTVEF